MPQHEDRFDFDDYDGTPGKSWDDFDERLKNYAAGKTDDRGYSVADHLLKIDEGSINGPALPAIATEARNESQISRQKDTSTKQSKQA